MPQQPPSGPGPPHYRGFMITLRHTTFRRTPLYEWSARRRDLHLTTHKTHKRQTSMTQAEFEHIIPASERPETPTFYSTGQPKKGWNIKRGQHVRRHKMASEDLQRCHQTNWQKLSESFLLEGGIWNNLDKASSEPHIKTGSFLQSIT